MSTVAIPIETKVREFDGKLWLGLNLVKRGYDVVLGPSWEIKSAINVIKPDVYISKDPGDGNVDFFEKLRDSGVLVCAIAPEVESYHKTENIGENKNKIIKHIDKYFSWGEGPAEAIRSRYHQTDGIDETIMVTGNPRFDLVTREVRGFYEDGKHELQETYGDFILVNSNFAIGNQANRAAMIETMQKNHPDWDIFEEERVQSRMIHLFLELLLYLSGEDTGYNFVFRPHPGEDHSIYHRAFKHYDSVYVTHEDDVRKWIYAADGVLHHDCTTAIEAAMMGKPVVSYQPFPDATESESLKQVVSDTCTTREGVEEWISEHATSEITPLSPRQKERVGRYFPNIDRLAAPQICDTIDSTVGDAGGYSGYRIDTRQKLERSVKSSVVGPAVIDVYDRIRDITTDGGYQQSRAKLRQKFPELTKEEIHRKSQFILDYLDIDCPDVINTPRTRHTYTITSK